MLVTLIAHTNDPEKTIAAAAKLCYSDAHIETLLQDGAQIVSRTPFTLRISGHLFRVQHGMLIGNSVAA